MADRVLVKDYLLEAVASSAAPSGTAEQITWLQTQRTALSLEVREGDVEITNAGFEGGNASGRRLESAKARLAAVIAALEKLQGADAGGSLLLYPEVTCIHD